MIVGNNGHPFSELYLVPLMDLTRFVFNIWNRSEISVFDAIDQYMRVSSIRKGMDRGLPMYLNKGSKQVAHSIDESLCEKDTREVNESIVVWMADIYTYFQWTYDVSSEEISKRFDSRTLAGLYNPIHEMGLSAACRRLYERFFKNGQDK